MCIQYMNRGGGVRVSVWFYIIVIKILSKQSNLRQTDGSIERLELMGNETYLMALAVNN